jgi:uncharacterized protein with PhoU and TrkA domain
MLFVKRHLSIILIVFFALLAIAVVLWVFDKRLQRLNSKVKTTAQILPAQNVAPHRAIHSLLKYANANDRSAYDAPALAGLHSCNIRYGEIVLCNVSRDDGNATSSWPVG